MKLRNTTRPSSTLLMNTKRTKIQITWLAVKPRTLSFLFTEKKLRKVLLQYLQWMRVMKKDSTFREVMETQNYLQDTEGFEIKRVSKSHREKKKEITRFLVYKTLKKSFEGLSNGAFDERRANLLIYPTWSHVLFFFFWLTVFNVLIF